MPPALGRYGPARHLIVHLSDTHFVGSGLLYGRVDVDARLQQALDQLDASEVSPNAIVITGDVADAGEAEAYARVRALVEPVAERLGARVIWVAGNHDERGPFARELLDEPDATGPIDRVHDVDGLRIIALDTSVPGFHHGDIDVDQARWLAEVLAEPAEHGSVLALHHAPLPTPLAAMDVLELRHQERLAEAVAGSDVRIILGGHLHYATQSSFAGIPVSVASASCYTMSLTAPRREVHGVDGGRAISLLHFVDDQVVTSSVPVGDFDVVSSIPQTFLARLEGLSAEERLDLFSRKR